MKSIIWTVLIGFLLCSCDNSDDHTPDDTTTCDFNTVISEDLFANAPNDLLSIVAVEIIDDCLHIDFSASGCDGNTWEIQLIDAGQVLESLPVQRNIRLSLKNLELCDAVISKSFSFDISELQVASQNQVNLNLSNYNNQIVYEY